MIVEGLEVVVRCSRSEPAALADMLACDLTPEQLRRLADALLVAAARREREARRATHRIRIETRRCPAAALT